MLTLLKSDSDPRQSDCLCDRKRIRSCLGTLYNVHFSFGQLWICFRFYAFSCRPYCVSFDRQKWSYNKKFLDFLINQCSNIIKSMDSTRWIISWPDSVFSCSWHQASAERHEVVPERCRSRSFLCTSTTRIHFGTVPTGTRNDLFLKERERQERGTSSCYKSRSFSVVPCCTSTAQERLAREKERPRSRSFWILIKNHIKYDGLNR